MVIDAALKKQLVQYQRNEITEHHIYHKLATRLKSSPNSRVLQDIADDELRHYHDWRKYTREIRAKSVTNLFFSPPALRYLRQAPRKK